MRRRVFVLVAAFLSLLPVAAVLAGGAGENGTPASAEKEATLVGYLLGAAPPGMPDVMARLNEKLKKDIDATMEIIYIGWGDFQARYPLVLAAGEDIDWIFTANWSFYFQEAAKGAFLELTDQMLKDNMPRHLKALPRGGWDQARLPTGRLYMVPTSTPDRKVPLAVIRGDLRRKYGVAPVTKLNQIGPYLRAIKQNEPGMIPMYLDSQYDIGQPCSYITYDNGPYFEDILFATGTGSGLSWILGDPTKSLHYICDEPIVGWQKKAALTMKGWYDAGYLNKDVFANKVRSKDSFVQGKSGVGFGNSIDMQATIAGATANGWDVELVPGLDGASHYRADPFINNGVALAARTKNAARALQALDRIMEDPSYNFLVYFGVEGKNYVLTSDGKIDVPPGVTAGRNTYPADAAGFWFTDKDQFPPMATWTPAYTRHRRDIVDKGYLVVTPFVSFPAQTDEIKTEVANCNQVMVQYWQPLNIGAFSDVNQALGQLDQKLKAAGVNRIRQVIQAQIDAYMKRF